MPRQRVFDSPLMIKDQEKNKTVRALHPYLMESGWMEIPGNWTCCLETRLTNRHILGIKRPWGPRCHTQASRHLTAQGHPHALFSETFQCAWGCFTLWDSTNPPGFGNWEHGSLGVLWAIWSSSLTNIGLTEAFKLDILGPIFQVRKFRVTRSHKTRAEQNLVLTHVLEL